MKIQKFPGIPNWNSGSRESREFPGFTGGPGAGGVASEHSVRRTSSRSL